MPDLPTQRPIGELFGQARRLFDSRARDAVTDLVQTYRIGGAELYVSSSALTSIAEAGTFVKAAGTTTLAADEFDWSMPANNRLRYDGVAPRLAFAWVAASMTVQASNKNTKIAIAKNGTVITASTINRFVGTGSDEGAVSTHSFARVESGDYLEVWVANASDTTDLTLTAANLMVMDVAAV